MKRKRILSEIVVVILFCLLLPFEVRSVVLVSLEPHESQFPQILQKESTDSQKLETNSGCGTTKILENLKENWVKSGLEAQRETNYLSLRPTDSAGGIDGNQHLLPKLYNTTNFVFHWTNGTDGGNIEDAIPVEDSNANSIPDYIENCSETFENARNFEVNIRGFYAPPSDDAEPNDLNQRNPDGKYDVFIYDMSNPKYYGYACIEQWPDSPSYSYIVIENDFAGFSTQGLKAIQVTAAHEFFHAIQFYYDCNEELWWMETTATYMEDEAYPDVNDNYQYLSSWFQTCDYGLEYTNGRHEYGNFIFAKKLSEDFGDEIIKEIWEGMVNTNGLTAIENTLLSKNSTLIDEFSKFITANFFLEDMYADGKEYRSFITNKTGFNGVWLEYQYNASTAPNYLEINKTNVSWDAWMDKWATDYITLKLDPAKSRYRISFDGLKITANYLVKLATKKEGVISEIMFSLNDQKDGFLDLSYDTFDNATLIIANAGNVDTANPSWRVTIEVISEIYDVAIMDVKLSTYLAFPGQAITIAVNVKNNGNTRTESFNVSTWWGNLLIEKKSVMNLAPGAGKTLNITWTIPAELNGSEKIWADASIVAGEINEENNRFENGMLTIREGVHDIAIIEMKLARWVISREGNLTISTTIENQGDFTESFNVTTCTNTTVTQTRSVTMASHANTTLTFTWNTTRLTYGNYTICASASPVPGETDTSDNNFTCGTPVHVGVPGDISGPTQSVYDGKCDLRDVSYLVIRFNSNPNSANWNPNADINNDATVNMRDITIAILNFNQRE